MEQVIDIKTSIDNKSAIKSINDFVKQLDNLNKNTIATNKSNSESFGSFGDAVQNMLDTANSLLDDFQNKANDFDTSNINNNIQNSSKEIGSFGDALNKVQDLADSTKKELNQTIETIDDIGSQAKDASKDIDKLDDKLDNLNESSKGTSLALEALKDNLGGIPVIGQTLSRALDGVEGSFKSVVLAAAPVAGIAVGFTALAGTLYGAYQNSEKLRESISEAGNVGKIALNPLTSILENIGDAIAVVIDKFVEWQKKVNAVSGATARASEELANSTLATIQSIIDSSQLQQNILQELGASADVVAEEQKKMYESLQETAVSSYHEIIGAIEEQKKAIEESKKAQAEAYELYSKNKDFYDAAGANTYYENWKKASEAVAKNTSALDTLLNTQKQLKQTYKDSATSLQEFNKEQEKSKDTKIDLTPHQELEKLLQSIIVETENYVDLVESSSATEEEKTELIKNARLNALQSQKQALTDFAKVNGYDYNKDIKGVADLNEETGELEQTTLKLAKGYDEVDKAIKKLSDNSKKTFKDMQGDILSILGSISNITDSLISGIGTVLTSGVEDYSAYNQAIIDAQNELNEYLKELEEENAEADDEDYELKMQRLQEELERAIEAQDAMSANAIQDKMAELEAERKKTKEEEKLAKEQENTEKKLQNAVAQAEYNKELAIWNNQVKNAETQKNLAIAQAISQSAFGIAMASVGTATSFAQGGLVGAAAGLVLAGTIIGSITSAISGIYSAVQQYESVKANPPTPPQFATGTSGYTLDAGQSAIVGELGAERVRNMGDGRIAVDTARVTEYAGYSNGNVYNFYVTITDSYINNKEDLINELMNIKKNELEALR